MFSACLSLILAAVILSISCFLQLPQLSYGAPILPPDLTKCSEASDNSVVGPHITLYFNCCLPLPTKKVVDFSFKKYPLVKRRRGPAHKVSKAYIKKYNKAYELMKALPADDPRAFAQQAKVHCAFCNGAYTQLGNDIKLQVHFSWLFLPWHRWFLYFHERILAKLIDDPDFSLLFWNWDNQKQGNTMPAVFAKNGTAIYDANRNPSHLPPALLTLNVASNTTNKTVIVDENLNAMYQGVVTASTAELFLGGAYRVGVNDSNSTVLSAPLGGSIENGVHNAVHFWTGDPELPLFQDMGTFTTAARDPIFYSHHSNVDRLWDVWRTLPGGRRHDHTDSDFLNAEFVFYDEDANLVKVKVRDALDNKKLGIRYKKVKADELWINYKPQAASNGSVITNSSSVNVTEIGLSLVENATKSIEVGKKVNVVVDLPSKPSAEELKAKGVKKAEDLNEVLVIKEVEVIRDTFVRLMVFVNLPDADAKTSTDSAEYVGSLNVAPTPDSSKLVTNLKLDIGDNLKRVGIQDAEKVVITILIKSHSNDAEVKLKGMKVEYE